MGIWTECKNCGNDASGDMIYLCKDDNFVFCQECGEGGFNINGNHNCVCPVCSSTSDVRIMGEIDRHANVPDTKCENCGNVDPDDMLYRCKKDDLYFCEQCGDRAWNAFGNNNCICPECHSTSNVKILGKIGGDEQDEQDVEEDNVEATEEHTISDEREPENYYAPESKYRNDETYSSYDSDDDYSASSNTSYSSGSTTSGGGSVAGWLIVIVIIVVILYWLGSKPAINNTTTTVSQPTITAQPAPVTVMQDSVKASVQVADSAEAPVSDIIIGENFLKKGVIYRFIRNGETQYNFIRDDNNTSAILTFSLSDNPQQKVLQLLATGPIFALAYGNERPPAGNYLVVSDNDLHFHINEVSGSDNATLDTYRPGAPNMNDFVTQLPPNCREETMNFVTYYITEDNYYYQDWTNPDGSKGLKW